jgi:hypothetical protein
VPPRKALAIVRHNDALLDEVTAGQWPLCIAATSASSRVPGLLALAMQQHQHTFRSCIHGNRAFYSRISWWYELASERPGEMFTATNACGRGLPMRAFFEQDQKAPLAARAATERVVSQQTRQSVRAWPGATDCDRDRASL